MHASNDCYQLERSRLAIAFRTLFFCIISFICYVSLPVIWWVISVIGCIVIWLIFKPDQVEVLELLDKNEWSLSIKKQQKIERVNLKKIINHHFYIVIYFQEKNPKSLVIWKDQLNQKKWKRLLARAQLH